MVGPDFKPPAPIGAASYLARAPGTTQQSEPDPNWWNGFNDPVLTQLMQLVIAGNPSLQQALLRVQTAHETTVSTAAEGLPTLGANGSYMREQEGLKGLAESSGAYNQLARIASEANAALPGAGTRLYNSANGLVDQIGQPVNFFQYGLSSSWELDLFGRVRRSVEAAHASEAQARDAARDSLVMLESETAQIYFQLRAAQAALAQQQEIVQTAQEQLQLTLSQARTGLAPESDVEQARTEFLSVQQQLPAYEKNIAQDVDQIDLLAGREPGSLDAMLMASAPLPAPPAVIGAGIPSTLARRRPDIREAEDSLHAATAEIGVAVASFYPDVSLTGSVGYHAFDASYLTNWASFFYGFGPSISLPVFDGGRLIANLRTARLTQANAALQYRATVLNALAEVETDLVAYRSDQQANADALATVASAADSSDLALSRYRSGLTSYLPALDAERTLFSAQQQAIQTQAQLDVDVASLFTALGGGWQETERTPQAPPVTGKLPPAPAALDAVVPH